LTALQLFSERFGPLGNVAGEGVLNPLGRPPMDPLTVMVRETVQNSWDARIRTEGGVRYQLALWTVRDQALATLRSSIFGTFPETETTEDLPLASVLWETDPVYMLAISDAGTLGLGGATRADDYSIENDPRDFVDFFRNVGEPPDQTRITGGTYGYGKASLFLASRARTLLVHTRCHYLGRTESRLMGVAIGQRYLRRSGPAAGRYTGRHWWGAVRQDLIEPVLSEEADELAASIGLPIGPSPETGTTIAIIGPDVGDLTLAETASFLAEALLWHFWPKFLPTAGGSPAMNFRIVLEGSELPIPDPRQFPPLDGYVAALDDIRRYEGEVSEAGRKVEAITRYGHRIGVASVRRFPYRSRRPVHSIVNYPRPISGPPDYSTPSHHIALLRGPEFVVKYLVGPEIGSDDVEYGGVFLADASVDRVFADSEPPAHDDWVPTAVGERSDQSTVRVALREVRNLAARLATPMATDAAPGEVPALGEFSSELTRLFPGAVGEGGSPRDEGERGGGAPRSGARIRVLGPAVFREVNRRPAALIPFEVRHRAGSSATVVRGSASVVLDDGSFEPFTEAPVGATLPELLGWIDSDGRYVAEPAIEISADRPGTYYAVGSIDAGFVTGIELIAETLEQA
jgi:hypothetical protein